MQQAIEGKLVPQLAADGNAQDLVDNIREHKAELIREKKLKKDPNESYIYRDDEGHFMERIGKQEPVCIDENLPFVVPEGWTWARLGSIETVIGGYAFQSENFTSDGSRVIRISDIGENGFINNRIVRHVYVDALSPFIINQNDILIAMTGGTVGKSLYVQNLLERRMLLNQRVAIVRCGIVNSSYVSSFVKSYYIQSEIDNVKNSTNDNISMKNIMNFLLPLPPLAEQARIVKKVEELMPLAERFEKQSEELELLNGALPGKLRKSILQHAIKGLLVPQLAADGNAQDLVDNIREHKAELIREKKLKKDPNESYIYRDDEGHFMERIGKQEPVCIDENLPFAVPEGWTWARLGEIGEIVTGSTPPKEIKEYYGNDVPFYKPSDLDRGIHTDRATDNLSFKGYECARKLPISSILVTCIGTLGKTGMITKEGTCNQQINAIICKKEVLPCYVYYTCLSNYMQKKMTSKASATTIPILNKNKFSSLLLPLPPLAEQARIVKKVEELMEKVDKMEKAMV